MPAFDSDVLKTDPAIIALGGAGDAGALTANVAAAASQPDREAPACQAALAGYRTALIFRVLFTVLAFAVCTVAAAGLVYAGIKIITDGADLGAVISGIGGLLTGAAAGVLFKRMGESIRLARQALKDVGTYCGPKVATDVGS